MTDPQLDEQLEEIQRDETSLETQIGELRAKIAGADSIGANMGSAETLLEKLGKRLTGTLSWEQKRRLVEILVASIRVHTTESFGVKQAEITVNYRFSQPDQIVPVVLPQSYGTGKVVRIPVKPETIGDHIRLRRLGSKLIQKEVAEEIGVELTSVHNWESNRSVPEVRYMPAIIRFLGYNPLPDATGWGQRLIRQRTILGLSQKESARQLGVDPCTLARWERGEREPTGRFLSRVKGVLAVDAILAAGGQLAG
jgi:transcriptional regulator with XRE-family HTH domain